MRRIVAVILAALAILVCTATGAAAFPYDDAPWDATEPPNRRIMLVGDSLVGQSGPTAVALGEQREHVVQANPVSGGAACDFTPTYGADASAFDPDAVAFAFVGNATSDCMVAELGWTSPGVLNSEQVAAIVAAYRKYLGALASWNEARDVTTWLVASPVMAAGTYHGQITAAMNTMLLDMANGSTTDRVHYSAHARALLSPSGAYQGSLAGLTIRHTDGTHLRAPYGTTLHATGLLVGPMTGGQG